MDESNKEVRFDIYCQKCTHYDTQDEDEPCNTCLSTGVRYGTEKPELYEEDKNGR